MEAMDEEEMEMMEEEASAHVLEEMEGEAAPRVLLPPADLLVGEGGAGGKRRRLGCHY